MPPSEPPPPLPPRIADALTLVAGFFAGLLRTRVDATPERGERYYDARSAPMGRRTFLRLARAGAFPTFRAGRRLLARRADVHAWIEAQEGARLPPPRESGEEPLPSDPAALHELLVSRPGLMASRQRKP